MSKKFWLGFGGISIRQTNKFGLSITNDIETARGDVIFEPVYRFKATDINHNIKNKFLGYRVIIRMSNMVNAWSGDEDAYRRLINMINTTNNEVEKEFRWTLIPKFSTETGALNYQFKDFVLDSDFAIAEPEMHKCFQDLELTFVSRKLWKSIPNLFDKESYVPLPKHDVKKIVEFANHHGVAVRTGEIQRIADTN